MIYRTTPVRRGFTLVELLAVIGIIAAMAVVIGGALGGGNASTSLGTTQRVGGSIFQSARSIAVLKQTNTRVLIYGSDNAGDPNKSLKFMQVVYEVNDQGEPEAGGGKWIAANPGTYLPQGTYFIPTNGDLNTYTTSTDAEKPTKFSSDYFKLTGTERDIYPNLSAVLRSAGETKFYGYYYSYDANGLCNQPGAQVVFAAGSIAGPPVSGVPKLTFDNQYAVVGFFLRRLGQVSMTDYEYLN